MVSSTPLPHFTPRKEPVPILQETGWALGPVRAGGKSRRHRYSTPDHPARSLVAIPTELPGPRLAISTVFKYSTNNIQIQQIALLCNLISLPFSCYVFQVATLQEFFTPKFCTCLLFPLPNLHGKPIVFLLI